MQTSALYSKLKTDSDRKLLVLKPELLAALEKDGKLEFKASKPEDSVVLCSKNKTWLLKQKNHSNTVLVMKEFIPEEIPEVSKYSSFKVTEPSSYHLGYAKQSNELEPRLTAGEIDISQLPIYTGDAQSFQIISKRSNTVLLTLDELRQCSPCSQDEFAIKWPVLGGCVVENTACILSHEFTSRALHITLMSCMAESLDFEALDLPQAFAAVNKDMGEAGEFNPFNMEVVRTILGKFCVLTQEGKFTLQRKSVGQWYGIEALRKFASRSMIPQEEFMIKWKSLFPPYFNCDLDFTTLRGNFYRPLGAGIQYFSKEALPDNPKDRFTYLFKLQSTWDLDEMRPFIDQLNTNSLKIDSFVMKYARRIRQGKRTLISAR
ncbi:LANO_0G14378g1_1 [Lachancea nothofagi CBS 11611]|uniref:LANO_0G14378g1_1 n=1 Tax=Lachancea nothofagi CBS 11611 TaxID=1266666 RepID=A0A1G4KKH0_9SACH|nr:LANO_0G14378g1_1 [Lachancea nothofagi CBS 11611]